MDLTWESVWRRLKDSNLSQQTQPVSTDVFLFISSFLNCYGTFMFCRVKLYSAVNVCSRNFCVTPTVSLTYVLFCSTTSFMSSIYRGKNWRYNFHFYSPPLALDAGGDSYLVNWLDRWSRYDSSYLCSVCLYYLFLLPALVAGVEGSSYYDFNRIVWQSRNIYVYFKLFAFVTSARPGLLERTQNIISHYFISIPCVSVWRLDGGMISSLIKENEQPTELFCVFSLCRFINVSLGNCLILIICCISTDCPGCFFMSLRLIPFAPD